MLPRRRIDRRPYPPLPERIAGAPFPADLYGADARPAGAGRGTPTAGGSAAPGGPDARLPLALV
ncbi:hypothetical protein ROS62_15065 [Streptomyces sp. DSM 41972]|uniref:Uncharacterized protein n=1 Tax=Streptomyces althioticus subsp. attaecolombicae TaxID=3075534 RepID=A0ABU3HZJ2_9ACTN|nr:hypothetical protein [Streptomyces sp. DSM 41972]SCD59917.1 hypothetical protein GA0115238_11698 [Streptomyces sp. di50b]